VTWRRSAASLAVSFVSGGVSDGGAVGWRRWRARFCTERSNSVEQLEPMTNCRDAKLLKRLVRQARKDCLIYLILAERSLILPEAKRPQPTPDIHGSASACPSAILCLPICHDPSRGSLSRVARSRTASDPKRRFDGPSVTSAPTRGADASSPAICRGGQPNIRDDRLRSRSCGSVARSSIAGISSRCRHRKTFPRPNART